MKNAMRENSEEPRRITWTVYEKKDYKEEKKLEEVGEKKETNGRSKEQGKKV